MVALSTLSLFYQKGGPLFLRQVKELLRMCYETGKRLQSRHAWWLWVGWSTRHRVVLLAIWVLENLSWWRRLTASSRMRRRN